MAASQAAGGAEDVVSVDVAAQTAIGGMSLCARPPGGEGGKRGPPPQTRQRDSCGRCRLWRQRPGVVVSEVGGSRWRSGTRVRRRGGEQIPARPRAALRTATKAAGDRHQAPGLTPTTTPGNARAGQCLLAAAA